MRALADEDLEKEVWRAHFRGSPERESRRFLWYQWGAEGNTESGFR